MATNIPVQVVISAVDKASDTLKGIGGTLSKQAVDWKKWSLVASGAMVAAGAAMTKFARDASKTDAVKTAFGEMTRGIVEDTDEFVRAMKRASSGTLAEYDILVNANRALSLIGKEAFGKDFTKSFSDAMAYIRKASRATGYDIKYLTDSFVLGIGRQSKLILDNLGITTNLTKAYEEYAEQLGKNTEDLTDAERKTAALNHVMDLLEEKYGNVSLGGQTLDEQMQELSATWRDLRDEIGRKFIPVITKLLREAVIPFIKNYGPKFVDLLGKIVDGFTKLPGPVQVAFGVLMGLVAVSPVIWGIVSAFTSLVKIVSVVAGLALKVGAALLSLNPVVLAVIAVVVALIGVFILIRKHWDSIIKFLNNVFIPAIRGGFEKLKEWISEIMNSIKEKTSRIWSDIKSELFRKVEAIRDAVVPVFYKIRDEFSNAWKSAKSEAGGVLDSIIGFIKPKIEAIKNWISSNWARWGIHIEVPDFPGMVRRWKEGVSDWVRRKLERLPDFLRSIGEQFYYLRGWLPSFQEGGIVPGPIGKPQLAIVHGGEEVIPPERRGSQVNLTVNVGIYAGSAIEKRQLAMELWRELGNLARSMNKTPEELLGFRR